MRKVLFLLVVSFLISPALKAQRYLEIPRFEAGLQFDATYMNGVGDWGGGLGGRFHYNFDEHFALDSELVYRKHDLLSVSGTTLATATVSQSTGLFGVRAGVRREPAGFFLHARAGFLHFSPDNGANLLTRNTFPTFDAGGTIEHYSGPVILRLDVGAQIVPYGDASVSSGPIRLPSPSSGALGTRVSPSIGLGFALRF